MFRVLIADDHPLFRTAVRQVIESLFQDYEILEAGTLDEASRFIDEAEGCDIDLVLLDLQMPGSSGFSGLVSLRNAAPWVPIIVVSATAPTTPSARPSPMAPPASFPSRSPRRRSGSG